MRALPTPHLARKEGITPGIKNLSEVGLPTSLGGEGEAWSLFWMTRAESSRSQDNLRCLLSVLAAEEINFLCLPAYKEKFSDLLCCFSQQLRVAGVTFICWSLTFTSLPPMRNPSNGPHEGHWKLPLTLESGTSGSSEGCGKKLQGVLHQCRPQPHLFGNVFSMPPSGHTWICFRS